MINCVKESELAKIASQSLRNCHAMNVDSVLFEAEPPRVRAFVAHMNHELHRNLGGTGLPLSVALHPHHCDLELTHIFGWIYNVSLSAFEPRFPNLGVQVALKPFRYQSPIGGKAGSFVAASELPSLHGKLVGEQIYNTLALPAQQLHTIHVSQGYSAAWFVHEGKEDPNYSGLCYSNDDLTKFDFRPYYRPMSVSQLRDLLAIMRVEIQKGV